MIPDQELLFNIAKWRWPHIDWELAPVGDSLTGPSGEYFVIHTDYIEPIWQEHGQKVIADYDGDDKFGWLNFIATGTAHDKAVALGEWIDAENDRRFGQPHYGHNDTGGK